MPRDHAVLVTGQPPFPAEKVSQKLIAHQTKPPAPIRTLNPSVPEGLAVVVHKLLAKKPDDRYRTATDVLEALAPFVQPTPPVDDDFPTTGSSSNYRSGISLNGWVSMNITDKSAQSSASGSAIRFHSDTNPKLPASQAQQQTKANAAQETLPARPGLPPEMPATPAPKPRVKSVPKPEPIPHIELKLPPKPAPIADRGSSTAIKADRLFRDCPADESNLWDRGRWITIGLTLLLLSVAAVFFKFLAR